MRDDTRLRPPLAGHRPPVRPRRRAIRARLALLFFAVFLASGAVLLAVTFAIWAGRTRTLAAHPIPASAADAGSATAGVTQVSSDRHQLLLASGIALAV